MTQNQVRAKALAERLCQPQRVGLFGRRGVGKTTFLTMLYREAVGGRLPQLRLAAADARTANYLSDKILQVESGQPLPATLGETELHFHLYHKERRFDLLVRDYQGEHVALGRQEPIRAFLRDCDAVWLCLDVSLAATPEQCLRAQQEAEQMVEDYLGEEATDAPPRPMGLVLTKTDLLDGDPAANGTAITALVQNQFGMARHAIQSHSPQRALLPISSLGGSLNRPPDSVPARSASEGTSHPDSVPARSASEGTSHPDSVPARSASEGTSHPDSVPARSASEGTSQPDAPARDNAIQLKPSGLAGPLAWLADALQVQDEARLRQLWRLAPNGAGLLQRCVACLERRYPHSAVVAEHRRRLSELRRKQIRHQFVVVGSILAALMLSLWAYDAWGHARTRHLADADNANLRAVRGLWQSYQFWHPTRHLFRPAAAQAERGMLHDLDERIREQERGEKLAEIKRQAADGEADPETVWQEFRRFQEEYPEYNLDETMQAFGTGLQQRRQAERERRAREGLGELTRLETRSGLPELLQKAERLLQEHAGTSQVPEIRRRLEFYLRRLDERDIETARAYSARQPFNFHSRREHFLRYLEHHPAGAFVKEATTALPAIDIEWDRHDFRAVRDLFQSKPGELKELETRCRSYLTAHPTGRFREDAVRLLRWSEKVAGAGEYKVVLKNGAVDSAKGATVSRGMNLSVELEVNGVIYGPSPKAPRGAEATWDYEFPRLIQWKLGDRVRIRVIDNYYWRRQVAEFVSEEGDPLALRMLSGTICSGKNRLLFESDFNMPVLPKIE